MTYVTEMNSKYYCQTQNKLKFHKLTKCHHDKKGPKITQNYKKINENIAGNSLPSSSQKTQKKVKWDGRMDGRTDQPTQ